jgi:hypothetical protein
MSDEPRETPVLDWSAVTSVGNEAEATFIVGFLESRGIPARIVDKSFSQNPVPNDEDLASIEVAVPVGPARGGGRGPRQARDRLRRLDRGRGDPDDRRGPAEIDPTGDGSN